jgi:ABC-type sulfate transport system substrate-binding protein
VLLPSYSSSSSYSTKFNKKGFKEWKELYREAVRVLSNPPGIIWVMPVVG